MVVHNLLDYLFGGFFTIIHTQSNKEQVITVALIPSLLCPSLLLLFEYLGINGLEGFFLRNIVN